MTTNSVYSGALINSRVGTEYTNGGYISSDVNGQIVVPATVNSAGIRPGYFVASDPAKFGSIVASSPTNKSIVGIVVNDPVTAQSYNSATGSFSVEDYPVGYNASLLTQTGGYITVYAGTAITGTLGHVYAVKLTATTSGDVTLVAGTLTEFASASDIPNATDYVNITNQVRINEVGATRGSLNKKIGDVVKIKFGLFPTAS